MLRSVNTIALLDMVGSLKLLNNKRDILLGQSPYIVKERKLTKLITKKIEIAPNFSQKKRKLKLCKISRYMWKGRM